MTTNTNAPSAELNPTTLKTGNTTTAPGATFGGHPTISSYIAEQLKEAASDAASSAITTAETLSGLGFTASANIRYARFLEAYRSQTDLAEHYATQYPNCVFLPWKALHETLNALNLWVELPEHYLGAVPSGQLPYIEMFELEAKDTPGPDDWVPALGCGEHGRPDYRLTPIKVFIGDAILGKEDALEDRSPIQRLRKTLHEDAGRAVVDQLRWDFCTSLFVVAPPEAFKTEKDWLTRAFEITDKATEERKLPPNDPLVIRMVRGGCLVVAAWGDEAAHINEFVKQISNPNETTT